ncbi:MAG: flagellar protein FliT [Pseudomonadota bacterium]
MNAALALADEILAAAQDGDWELASELAATRDQLVRQLVGAADGQTLEQLIDSDTQLKEAIRTIQRDTAADIAKLHDGKRAVDAYQTSAF